MGINCLNVGIWLIGCWILVVWIFDLDFLDALFWCCGRLILVGWMLDFGCFDVIGLKMRSQTHKVVQALYFCSPCRDRIPSKIQR